MSKTYTQEQAQKLGKDALNSAKTYGAISGFVQWCAANEQAGFDLLAEAIKVSVDAPAGTEAQKATRKSALDGWTNTLKRVKKGDKPEKGQPDNRPFLAYSRDEGTVLVGWKLPKPKAEKAGGGDGEEQGETGGTPGEPKALTNDELLAMLQARIEADAAFAAQVEEMVAALIG